MSRPRVTRDSYTPGAPVRIEACGATLHLTRAEADDLHTQLGGVLMSLDPPDTERPLPAEDETPTRPSSPEARRKSSDRMQAVTPEAAAAFIAAREKLPKT